MSYQPEQYWDDIARHIAFRRANRDNTSSDNPAVAHRRRLCVEQLVATTSYARQVVLEVGVGSGGNLIEIARRGARRLIGADISAAMLELARQQLREAGVAAELVKIDGRTLPLSERSVDMALTVTVLSRVTDDETFQSLTREICRVAATTVILIEPTRVEQRPTDDDTAKQRPVTVYAAECDKHGFALVHRQSVGTRATRHVGRAIRRLEGERSEGTSMGTVARRAMSLLLPVSGVLDRVVTDDCPLTKMVFVRRHR